MTKVNLDTIRPWVTRRITELLNFEDDVVIEFIFNQLDERVTDFNFCAIIITVIIIIVVVVLLLLLLLLLLLIIIN